MAIPFKKKALRSIEVAPVVGDESQVRLETSHPRTVGRQRLAERGRLEVQLLRFVEISAAVRDAGEEIEDVGGFESG